MTTGGGQITAADPGLITLVTLLRFLGIGADPEQIRHRFGGSPVGIPEMLRVASEFGLKARARKTAWSRLPNSPLPAIAALKDGGFMFLGKAGEDKVLVQSPSSPRPALMTQAEFEAVWDGRLVFMTRRAGLLDLSRRFDITWFLGAIHKYRRLLAEVLVASFFLQLFALVSPLFFQVVIDKVLVHRSMSTLDVLILGLVAVGIFETIMGILRTYLVRAHDQPHRRRARRAAVPSSARAADRLFPGTARGRFGRARARAREHPQLSDQLGAHPGHRSALHLRFPGGDVPLFAVADLDRACVVSLLHRHLGRSDAAVPAAARREVRARCRESGIPGGKRDRRGDAQVHGGRAADAAALGGAARRLCRSELQGGEPRQHREPIACSSSTSWSLPERCITAPGW